MAFSIEIRRIKFEISISKQLAESAKTSQDLLPAESASQYVLSAIDCIEQQSYILIGLFFDIGLSNLGEGVLTMSKEMMATLQSLKEFISSNDQEKELKDREHQTLTEVIDTFEAAFMEQEISSGYFPRKFSNEFDREMLYALIDCSLQNLLTATRDALEIESSLDELKELNFLIKNRRLIVPGEVLVGGVNRLNYIVVKAISMKAHYAIEDRNWVPEECRGLVSDVTAEFQNLIRILKAKGVEEDDKMEEIQKGLMKMNECINSINSGTEEPNAEEP